MKKTIAVLLSVCFTLLMLPGYARMEELSGIEFSDISIEEQTAVTKNLSLITQKDGVTYQWKSSNEAVISSNGVVTRPLPGENDITVMLTVSATTGGEKSFTVTVKAFRDAEEILKKVRNELSFSVLSKESVTCVTENLYLPSRWNNNTYIYWTSNNESILQVAGTTGIVKRPPFGEGLSCVVLSAQIAYENQWVTKSFLVRVCEQEIGRPYSKALQEARDGFDRQFLSAQNLLSIRDDLVIPSVENSAVTVSCISQNPEVLQNDGTVTRSLYQDRIAEFVVSFRYGYEETRLSYAMVIKAVSSDELMEKIEEDLDWVIGRLESNYNLNRLTENLSLPVAGSNGSVLRYTSGNTKVMEHNGSIIAGSAAQTVTLTIEASLNGQTLTREIPITVAAKNSYQQSGGGSSSGGNAGSGGGGNVTMQMDFDLSETQVFRDVPKNYWAYEAIRGLKNKNIVEGDENGNFRPDSRLTREELVKMVVLTVGVTMTGCQADFKDVDEHQWCYPYIAAAVTNGIIRGRDDGSFGRGETVTRQDAAVILYNAMQKMGFPFEDISSADDFADFDTIAIYARVAVSEAKAAGLINGKGDNRFMPLDDLSRAEAAAMLWRLLHL